MAAYRARTSYPPPPAPPALPASPLCSYQKLHNAIIRNILSGISIAVEEEEAEEMRESAQSHNSIITHTRAHTHSHRQPLLRKGAGGAACQAEGGVIYDTQAASPEIKKVKRE